MSVRPSRRKELRRLFGDARGATAVEYGLIVGLIVIVMIATFVMVADTTTEMWTNVSDKVTRAR